MHAGDDQIHLSEHIVGEIEIAVGQNIDFDTGEDRDAVDLLVGFADALDVNHGALVVKTVGEGQVLGVIRNGHVLVAARLGSCCHFFDRVLAVGFDGVHVHVALQIVFRDEGRESVVFGGVYLAEILTQFGRNVIELQLGVDFFFDSARNRFFVFRSARLYSFSV